MEATHKFLNVSDAAAYLGVSAASLRKWSDQGLVRVYRTPGGQRRYAPEDLDGFLASMRQPVMPQAVPRYGRTADIGSNAEHKTPQPARQQPAHEQPVRGQPAREVERRRTRRAA